jgi:uncharacterized repeat protein (TIGR01451 family)
MTPWFTRLAGVRSRVAALAGVSAGLLIFLLAGVQVAHAQSSPPPTSTVCSSSTAKVSLTSSPAIYQDYHKAPELTDNYVQFLVTNTSAYTIEAVQLGFSTTTPIQRALHEDGWYDVKLAPGKSGYVYFYVHTDEANPHLNGSMWVAPWTGDKAGTPPQGTGLPLCTHVQPVTVEDTNENSSNKVNTIRAVDLGDGCFQMLIAGQTGNTTHGVNMLWSYTPATTEKWPADLLNLKGVSTVITFTAQPKTYTDTLFITDVPDAGSNGWPYQTAYTFCMGQISEPIDPAIPNHPASFLNSSSDMTHNDIGVGEIDAKYALLVARKDDGGVTAIAGDRVVYTITVGNLGTIAETSVILTDTVPANTRFSANGSSSQWSPSCVDGASAGSVCAFTIPTVNAGQTLTYTFALTVDQAAPASVTSVTNTVTGDPSTIKWDDFTPVIRQAKVGITKSDGVSSVVPGEKVTYTIVVSNAGPSALMGATVSDAPPLALLNPTWQSTASNATSTPSSNSGDINATVTISSGGRITYTLNGTLAPDATGTLANTAKVMPPAGITLVNSITEATDIDTLVLAADLSITKSASPTPTVVAGETLTYTLVVANGGPSNIAGALINDALPGALTNALRTCVAGSGANCGSAGGSGSLSNVPVSLQAGSTLTITLVGKLDPAASGSIANTATITVPAGATDTHGANNSSTVKTQVAQVTDLSIDKRGPATAVPGTQLTYTIIVTNNGPSLATNVTVSDAVPANLSFVSGAGCVVTNNVLRCNAGTLGVDESKTFTVKFSVAPAARSDVTNTASVTSTQNTTGKDDTVVTTLTPLNDLVIVKTAPATAVAGTQLTYTLVVTNNGPSVATNVTVSDVVPGGLTFVSGAGCAVTNSVLTCNAGTLTANTGRSFEVVFKIDPAATGKIANTAGVTSTETPTETTTTVTTTLTSLADLDIVKLAPETAVAGTEMTYALVVTNNGPSVATNVTVSDVVPNGLSLISRSPACSLLNNALTCKVDSLAVKDSRTFTATFAINAGATGMIVNTAGVTSTETPTETTTTVTTTLTSLVDLDIVKLAPETAVAGMEMTYSLVVTNNGPSVATNVTISDVVPGGLTFVSGADCDVKMNVLRCDAGILPVGGNKPFSVIFKIDPAATGKIENTAGVTSTETPTETTTTVTTTLTSLVDLDLVKEAPATAVAGTEMTYALVVTNNGPSVGTDVTVSDVVPNGLMLLSASPACSVPNGVLTCQIDVLGVKGGQTFTATFSINAGAEGEIVNTAVVTSTETPTETSSIVTTTLTSLADLDIIKSAPATVTAGEDLTYTLWVTNNGPSVANNVSVSDTVPAGLALVNAPAQCNVTDGVLICDAGKLLVNTGVHFDITFSVAADVRGVITNTATVTSTETPTETTTTVTTTVTAVTDLTIEKTGPATAIPGDGVSYQVVITNNGPSKATNVVITDPTPANLTLQQGSPCVAGVCSVGSLDVGEQYELTLEYAIDPFATGSVTNTAGATSVESVEPISATVTTLLQPEADLVINKTDGLDYAIFGTEVTYTIQVWNDGPSGVVGANVSDTLPDEVTSWAWACEAVSPNACSPAGGNGVITPLVTLAPDGMVTITAVAQLATGPQNAQDQLLTNVASVEAPPEVMDEEPDNNTSVDETFLLYQVDARVTKTVLPGDVIAPGQWFTYVVSVFNAGPSVASFVQVVDNLPAEMTSPAWTCQSSTGGTCQAASGSGSVEQYIKLDRGAWVTYTIAGEMDHSAGGEVVNTAVVDAGSEMVRELDSTNDTAAVTVTVMPNATVHIGKTDGQRIAVPGTTITYQITLRNDGPSDVHDSELLDVIPPALSNVQVSWQGSNGAAVKGDPSALVAASSVKVSLPEQSTLTVTVSGEVNLAATGWLTNVATFVLEGGIAANNPITQAIDVDEIVPAMEMGMIFHDVNGNAVFDAGDTPMPDVRVMLACGSHAGVEVTSDANGVFSQVVPPGPCDMDVVTASVPAGYRLTTHNDHQANVAHEGMNVMPAVGYQGLGGVSGVTFNDVNANRVRDAGEAALPNVVVTLAPSEVQPAMLHAVVSTTSDANGNYAFADVPEGGYALNAVTPAGFVNTTVLPQNVVVQVNVNDTVDVGFQNPGVLVITKAAQAGGVNNLLGADRLISYTLIVTNNGGGMLNNVLVTDTLESYLQYVNGSATPAPLSTSPLVWQLGSLAPGASVKIQFVALVTAGYSGASSNVAVADSEETAQVPSNETVVNPTPTAISIVRFAAQRDAGGVTVQWQTGFERNTLGFNLLRSATGSRADAIQVNAEMIPAGAKGGEYTFVDASADAGARYTYWLQEIEMSGQVNDYPDTAVVQGTTGQGVNAWRVFVPAVMR